MYSNYYRNGEWHIFTGNELGALLGWWSLMVHKMLNTNSNLDDVYMLSSAVSSKILKTMADHDGFHFIETLTGFKWMGMYTVNILNCIILDIKKHKLHSISQIILLQLGSSIQL